MRFCGEMSLAVSKMDLKEFVIKSSLKPKIWNYEVVPVIGSNVKLQDAFLDCKAQIVIGDDTFFGIGVMVLTGGHDYQELGLNRQTKIKAMPIYIGKGVWIASRAIILAGVVIGDYSVIGAGSVVTRSVPERQLWAGNPAKFIKNL